MTDLQWNRDFALEQAGEDEELLEELLQLLRESTASDLAKIMLAQEKEDAVLMGETAHSIKGAAASLGVEKLRVVASAMEQAGRNNDLAEAKSLVSALENIINDLELLK